MTGDRIRILIVDDDEVFLGDLARLMSARYEIVMAHTVKEALSAHERFAFDAALLDVDLGRGVDGLEILDHFHARDPDLPVIMVTRDVSAATALSAIRKGAKDYIDKRPDLGDLEARITRAVEEHRVTRHNLALRREIDELHGEMIGRGEKMQALRREIDFAAEGPGSVLIVGETGTGKELVAREIHKLFNRQAPFLAFNCAAGPPHTFSHKLFGSVPGGFTDAGNTAGVFELVDDGVLFLDEITEIGSELQASLLRVIQEREFERIGNPKRIPFRGKVLASTNRVLKESLKNGSLRDDLFFRFGPHVINVPPLRERREDIPDLVRYFLDRKSVELKRPKREMDDATMRDLCARDWPGNVRELENAIVGYLVRGDFAGPATAVGGSGSLLASESLYRMAYHEAKEAIMDEFRIKYTDTILAACGGDEAEAARRMGLSRFGLQKMRREIDERSRGRKAPPGA